MKALLPALILIAVSSLYVIEDGAIRGVELYGVLLLSAVIYGICLLVINLKGDDS